MLTRLVLMCAYLTFGWLPALSQDASIRVRGRIEKIEADTYIIASRDTKLLRVKLTSTATIVAIVKADILDIKPGDFVGVAALPQPEGTLRALEVHIFPEAMRGTGEGHRAWDLQPNSTMTNASVDQATVVANGSQLRLKYKDGEKTVEVRSATPVVRYAPSDKAELKPGASVFIGAAKQLPDGSLEASRVSVGRDIDPPM